MTSRPNAGHALFGKARRNILALLFGHADRDFYLNEIVKSAAAGVSQVQLELKRLTEAGLLLRERRANQLYFRANPRAPLFADIKNLVAKTFGVAGIVREALEPLESRIDVAFIYGSIASGEETAVSDIDLMVIGSAKFADIVEAMRTPQRTLGREINATVFPREEFIARMSGGDPFLDNVLQNPKIFLTGEEGGLSRLAEKRLSEGTQARLPGAAKSVRSRRSQPRR